MRRCYSCKVRIISRADAANSKKTYTERVATPHCESPGCDYCAPCRDMKYAQIRARQQAAP